MEPTRAGALAALGAFLCWGFISLYLKQLGAVPPAEVLAHRVIGGAVFVVMVQALWGRLGELRAAFADRRALLGLAGSSLAIGINWGLFIWAVNHGRALEASLGYFIFPLVSVALARLVLGERLSRRQGMAVALAGLGVVWLMLGGHGLPWLALLLASTFAGYGLLRKTIVISALAGLFVETAFLVPLAGFYLCWVGGGVVAHGVDATTLGLLALAGPVTAIPLVLFAYGARRLRLSTIGLMMYINPTVQMLVAVFVFGETFTSAHAVAFGAIWVGLVLYSWPSRAS